MNTNYHDDQIFDKLDTLTGREFHACRFTNCNLTEANFSSQDFIDCVFENCNLSNVKLTNAGLKDVQFINCKILGVDFGQCSDFLFQVSFRDCQLNYSTFQKQNLKNTQFESCIIREATFAETNLNGAKFKDCDLMGTVFDHANLSSADFSEARNYRINPTENNVKKARFSYPDVLSLLDAFKIDIV